MTIYGVEPDLVLGYAFEPLIMRYTARDVSLYALGVGAPADPLDPKELQFVYELSGVGFKTLPTFAVLYPSRMIEQMVTTGVPGLRYNPMMLLHGEQSLEVYGELPTAAEITCTPTISGIYDKGSGALLTIDTPCYDESGRLIASLRMSLFIRGIGGFGGERGTSTPTPEQPARAPDVVIRERTSVNQALLYRLSGDANPLHADPDMAAVGGFERPILHGLCSFGYAARAALKAFCDNDPARFKRIQARFAKHVFPGETLITELWRIDEAQVLLQTKVAERDVIAISNGIVELWG